MLAALWLRSLLKHTQLQVITIRTTAALFSNGYNHTFERFKYTLRYIKSDSFSNALAAEVWRQQ